MGIIRKCFRCFQACYLFIFSTHILFSIPEKMGKKLRLCIPKSTVCSLRNFTTYNIRLQLIFSSQIDNVVERPDFLKVQQDLERN